ncbi:protein FAM207A isoform X3 [Stegostoma tigrinum]|uniref:protein FAM207A isoform X3 n=1 Tax=Stegostoma tigrinum TaxID=3053191 RepID=UPI00286FE8B6|nr:protein FAM207A isoform X3 [Stegostoma tigrinum]
MVGKERRLRHRLHSAAVKFNVEPRARGEAQPRPEPRREAEPQPPPGGDRRRDADQLSTALFAEMRIDPKTLVQNLDVDSKTVVSSRRGDTLQISKKDKIKQRHERWLQKGILAFYLAEIEMIKLAEQKRKAQEKRKAVPVVGDMQPLADALPELTDLISASAVANKSKREEEVARFKTTIEDTEFMANPLAVIGEQLLKRMRQEDEDLK